MCKARPVYGSPAARKRTMEAIRRTIVDYNWQVASVDEIRQMRIRMQDSASSRNLKRGVGGTVDVEFTVQMLQLKSVDAHPDVLVSGTLDAIAALQQAGQLSQEDAEYFKKSYTFLRSVESGLRLMNTSARHDLPEDPLELKKLAFLIGYDNSTKLLEDCVYYRQENRERFVRLFDQAALTPSN